MANFSQVTTEPNSTAAVVTRSTLDSSPTNAGGWSREDLLPALSGVMLALAFAPTNLWFLAFIGLVPLFLYLDHPFTHIRTIRAGLVCPLVFYGLTLNWLAGMVGFSWLSVPAYLIVVFGYACGFFVFVLPVVALRHYLSLPFWLTAPFAWVAAERLRGYGDLAFPWSNLGCSLTNVPLVIQFADIVGVFGVSFWLVLLNALLFEMIIARRSQRSFFKHAIAYLVIAGSVILYDAVRWFGKPAEPLSYKEVALIQPNIPQKIKWDDRYARGNLDHIFKMNAAATSPAIDLVVWPESAVPYYIDEHRPFHLTEMGVLPPGNTYVLTGLLTSSPDTRGETRYFNAASLFDSHGNMLGRYKKIYLVPAAEKYPFRSLFGFTRAFFSIQDVSYGAMDPGTDFTVFQLPGAKFSVMICYESVYPQLARQFRLAGANFLVNITNDAWFGRSFAPYQHAAFQVLRAIENRTAIVRCANTGISGFVDPWGRWQQKTAIFTETTLSQKVPVTGTLTFYTRHGDLVVYLSYAALGLFLLAALNKKLRAGSQGEA